MWLGSRRDSDNTDTSSSNKINHDDFKNEIRSHSEMELITKEIFLIVRSARGDKAADMDFRNYLRS